MVKASSVLSFSEVSSIIEGDGDLEFLSDEEIEGYIENASEDNVLKLLPRLFGENVPPYEVLKDNLSQVRSLQ